MAELKTAIMVMRFIPLAKAHQLGLFGAAHAHDAGGGSHKKIDVKAHVARDAHGVHLVKEHQREVVAAKDEEKKPEPPRVPEPEKAAEPPKVEPTPEPVPEPPKPVDEGADATAVPGVSEQAIDTASDVSNIAIAREHLPMVRKKAADLGLEVEERPATASEILYHWGTPFDERDDDTIARAAEAAKGIVHLTITAPKSKESIVGTAERIQGEQPYLREFGERGAAWDADRVKGFSFRNCADCGRSIERNFAYLVRKPDGTIRQIGGTCAAHLNLANKLRDMLAKFEELANVIRGLGEGDSEGGGGGGGSVDNLVDPVAMFRVALATLQTRGFHSAKAYHAAREVGKDAPQPTSWSVRGYFDTQKALARGWKVSREDREEYERIRANTPTIAPYARKLYQQALDEAAAKLSDGGAMEVNAHTALSTGSKKLAGFSTFAAWKQLQEHRRSLMAHPPKPYVRESIADKMALPIDELRAGLQDDAKVLGAIEKSKATGKPLPKYAAAALETYVPGQWKVEDVREFDGQFGVTQKVRLRRESDGSGIEWSTSTGANGVRHGGINFDLGEASEEDRAKNANAYGPGMKVRNAVQDDLRGVVEVQPLDRRLQPGDVVRVHSAADHTSRDRADDTRTHEEKAEGAAKAAAGLQRRAATRMTRLNLSHVDPAERWTSEQRAAVAKVIDAHEQYNAETREHGHAGRAAQQEIENLKDHPGRMAHREASDAVYSRAMARPEVKAAAEAARAHSDAWMKKYREQPPRPAWAPKQAPYYEQPEYVKWRSEFDALDAPKLEAEKHERAVKDAALVEETAKTPVAPWHDPMETDEGKAKVAAIHTREAARGKAWETRREQLAKNVAAAREAALEEGVAPQHIDDHMMRRSYAKHVAKLQKGTVRFLVRMQIPMLKGQINLLTGKDEQGAAMKRVRIKAHTRLVGGKMEVVQAHEREVEVPAKHLPGPVVAKPVRGAQGEAAGAALADRIKVDIAKRAKPTDRLRSKHGEAETRARVAEELRNNEEGGSTVESLARAHDEIRKHRPHLAPAGHLIHDEIVADLEDFASAKLSKGAGMPMGMLQPPQPEASAVPPSTRVKYRHPESGEERDGHVHAGGSKGLTVVDEESGQAHKVPHGHYVVHPDEDGTPASKKKQAEAEQAAAEQGKAKPQEDPRAVAQQRHDDEATHGKLRQLAHELPAALAEARRDLRMGPTSRAAQAAAAALFMAQSGAPLRKVSDLKLDAKTVTCHDATVEDPALSAYLGALVKNRKPGDDVVQDAAQRACDYLNGHISDVEVTPDDLKQLGATEKWTAAAGKLGKVKDDADHADHVKQAARTADVNPKDVDPVSIAAHRKGVRRKGGASLGEHLDAVHKADPNDMRRAAPKEVA